MGKKFSEPVRLAIGHLEENGGSANISELAYNTAILEKLGRGLYIENLVYLMVSAGLVTFDEDSGDVRLLTKEEECRDTSSKSSKPSSIHSRVEEGLFT